MDGKRTTIDVPYTKGNKESGIRALPISDKAKIVLDELRKINGSKKYILQGKQGAKFSISTDHFNKHLKKYGIHCFK